ncbi:hypothetical protein C3L33_01671, partial [Rhododendron williamsianum]
SMAGSETDVPIHQIEEEVEDISPTSTGLDVDVELECQSLEVSTSIKSGVDIVGEKTCQSKKASVIANNGEDFDGEQVYKSSESSVDKNGMDNQGMDMDMDSKLEYQSPNDPLVDIAESTNFCEKVEADEYVVPELGVEFESEDHAYRCYNTYAALEGFSIRKDFINKSRANGYVLSRRYTCYKEGYRRTKGNADVKKPRKDTRTGCLAYMTIARQPNEGFRQKDRKDSNVKRPRKETRIGCLAHLVIARHPDGKYRITRFEEEHNHELVPFCRVRMLRKFLEQLFLDEAVSGGGEVIPRNGLELGFPLPSLGSGWALKQRLWRSFLSSVSAFSCTIEKLVNTVYLNLVIV